ncbi:MAG: DUF4190 domain-containing protein [Flavobacteriales bacterium]
MSEQTTTTKTSAGKGLGITALVVGIVGLIVSFIPCVGAWGIVPGILGVVFGAVSLAQASKGNGAKGLGVAGLVLSILAVAVALYQIFVVIPAAKAETEKGLLEMQDMFKKIGEDAKRQADSIQQANEMQQSLDAMDSLSTDSI